MIEIYIPSVYLPITKDSNDREKLFKEYVTRYIEKSFPELNFIKIKGMKAICEKR